MLVALATRADPSVERTFYYPKDGAAVGTPANRSTGAAQVRGAPAGLGHWPGGGVVGARHVGASHRPQLRETAAALVHGVDRGRARLGDRARGLQQGRPCTTRRGSPLVADSARPPRDAATTKSLAPIPPSSHPRATDGVTREFRSDERYRIRSWSGRSGAPRGLDVGAAGSPAIVKG